MLGRGARPIHPVNLSHWGPITASGHDGENLFGIPSQEISNCVGAFDYEGAIL